MNTKFSTSQTGAALVAVIVVLLILTSLLVAATRIIETRLDLAAQAKASFEEEVNIVSHVNNIAYLVATQRSTRVGISRGTSEKGAMRSGVDWMHQVIGDEIRVDGFEEKINRTSQVTFSLQDEQGLIPVNTSNNFWKERWLDAFNINGIDKRRLLDSLIDYSDADDRKQPAGAEQAEYESNDLPPPTNYLLQTCTELNNVIYWRTLLENYPEMLGQCSLSRRPSVNINAVPEELLRLLWPNDAESVISARNNQRWFANQYSAAVSIREIGTFQDDFVNFNSGSRFILTYKITGKIEKRYMLTRGEGILPPVVRENLPIAAYQEDSNY